ncbi:MAG: DUF3299 domain-containing protein [Alphaproteobacteria bacterium]
MRILSAALLAAVTIWTAAGPADAAPLPRETTWEDLAPSPEKPIEDPLAHLDPFISADLYSIASAVRQKETGFLSAVSPEYEEAMETKYRLEKRGVEVESILQQLASVEAEVRRLDEQVVDALDGQFVKIPGYALPVEFDGVAVREFLLVPYVGACIHVPPPPQNQMVFVKLSEPYLVESLFEPVWITGRITVQQTKKVLPVSDGKIPVSAGYTIEGATVEPYKE